MKKTFDVKKMTLLGLLLALVIVLQLVCEFVKFGFVPPSFAIIPVAIGAIILDKYSGAFLGAALGLVITFLPSTVPFLQYNFFLTLILCVLKTGLAGFLAGLFYEKMQKIIKRKEVLVSISALLVPLVNTSVFIIGVLTLFNGLMKLWANGGSVFPYVMGAFISINFPIEIALCVVLLPAINSIVRYFNKTRR